MRRFFTTTALLILCICNTVMAQSLGDYRPCAVKDLSASWVVEDGKNNVLITFTSPTQVTKYDNAKQQDVFADLNIAITKIAIQRMSADFADIQTVGTIDSPERGASLSFTDKDVPYGNYMYRAIVYVGAVTSNEWDWSAMKSVVVGQVPADFTFEDVIFYVEGSKVTIAYVAPQVSTLGEAMTMPMTCTLAEVNGMEPPTYTTINTVADAQPGKEYVVELNNISDGLHTYALQASTISGSNNGTYRYCFNVFVGKDVPGVVQNARAKKTEGGIIVSWEAPYYGLNGGDMGSENALTYTVVRKAGKNDAAGTVVAKNITALEYLDAITSDKGTTYIYEITATNAQGEGATATTNTIFLGEAAALPYTEDFESEEAFNSKWQKDYDGNYCVWFRNEGDFYVNDNNTIKAHGGKGLGYAMYGSFRESHQWDAITSEFINFSEAAKPALTFWLFDVAQGGSDMKLSIETSTDGNEFLTESVIAMGEAEADGWREVTVALPSLANANIGQVRFKAEAHGRNCFAIVIDDVTIDNTKTVDDDPGNNPEPTGDPSMKHSVVSNIYQLEALGMSDNHRYITGLNVATYSSFIWDTQTDEVIMHEGDHANSDFRAITDDGHAFGILSPDGSEDLMDVHAATFGLDGKATILSNDMAQIFDVTPDGSVAVGCALDEMWLPTACIWKDGVRQFLPMPTSKECGFEVSGANAMFVSADGSIVAGYLQDNHSSRPAIIWRKQDNGTYKADIICKNRWELNYGDGKTYLEFQASGLSANGKWLSLALQREGEGFLPTPEFMGRMNLITGELIESAEPAVDDFDAAEQSVYASSIADDGTCVGYITNLDGLRLGVIWKGYEASPRYLADVFPQLERLQDYDYFMNTPVSISPDAQYIAGFGCPITVYDDGLDYDFESYIISCHTDEFASIKTISLGKLDKNDRAYNIAGQRINEESFKGIMIKNGRKVVR